MTDLHAQGRSHEQGHDTRRHGIRERHGGCDPGSMPDSAPIGPEHTLTAQAGGASAGDRDHRAAHQDSTAGSGQGTPDRKETRLAHHTGQTERWARTFPDDRTAGHGRHAGGRAASSLRIEYRTGGGYFGLRYVRHTAPARRRARRASMIGGLLALALVAAKALVMLA